VPSLKGKAPLPEVLPGGRNYWRDQPYTIDACSKCKGWGTVSVELAAPKAKTKVWTNCPECKATGRRRGAPPLAELDASTA
jgi:hypothetical protein